MYLIFNSIFFGAAGLRGCRSSLRCGYLCKRVRINVIQQTVRQPIRFQEIAKIVITVNLTEFNMIESGLKRVPYVEKM